MIWVLATWGLGCIIYFWRLALTITVLLTVLLLHSSSAKKKFVPRTAKSSKASRASCTTFASCHFLLASPLTTLVQKIAKPLTNASHFAPVFASLEWLDKDVYRLRVDPLVSGKRSTTLQYPINGMRLKRVTEQELQVIVDAAQCASPAESVDPLLFVIAFFSDFVDFGGGVCWG